jgi:hypothetical protein
MLQISLKPTRQLLGGDVARIAATERSKLAAKSNMLL